MKLAHLALNSNHSLFHLTHYHDLIAIIKGKQRCT